MSASVEELSAQAEQLKELMSLFNTGQEEEIENLERLKKEKNKTSIINKDKGFKLDLKKSEENDSNFETY